jgi:hypothetical protein
MATKILMLSKRQTDCCFSLILSWFKCTKYSNHTKYLNGVSPTKSGALEKGEKGIKRYLGDLASCPLPLGGDLLVGFARTISWVYGDLNGKES